MSVLYVYIEGGLAMKLKFALIALVGLVASGTTVTAFVANPAPAPKTIKEVMKIAHKDGLMKKIVAGSATDEEKKQLLDLYIDMLEGEPKKGDKTEWKLAASATVVSAGKVVLGKEGAIDELKKTTDCMACHSKFK
ncbi:MAG: hypothetical protein NTY42_00520 [Planctomycetota bacterium]|nr:hypothetical protein [Planctomycetota bacterium]